MNAPSTPEERIDRAKAELAAGDHKSATVHALIAIAELFQAQTPKPVALELCPECHNVAIVDPDQRQANE